MRYFTLVGPRINIEWEMGVRSGSPLSTVQMIADTVSRMAHADIEILPEKCERKEDEAIDLQLSFSPVRLFVNGDMVVARAVCSIRARSIFAQALESQGFVRIGE